MTMATGTLKAYGGDSVHVNPLEQFENRCLAAAAALARTEHWEWSFDVQDFGREWHVTVRDGTFEASVCVNSAQVTTATAADVVVAQLMRMLNEFPRERL